MVVTQNIDASVEALEKAMEELYARMEAYNRTQLKNIVRLLTLHVVRVPPWRV